MGTLKAVTLTTIPIQKPNLENLNYRYYDTLKKRLLWCQLCCRRWHRYEGCRDDKLQYRQWKQSWHHDISLISVQGIDVSHTLMLLLFDILAKISVINAIGDITSSYHYDDVIMSTIASQITSLTIVYSTVYSSADQSKHQSSASLAFVWEIHRGPVNFPHKWPVTRKMFPFDDVIMTLNQARDVTCCPY